MSKKRSQQNLPKDRVSTRPPSGKKGVNKPPGLFDGFDDRVAKKTAEHLNFVPTFEVDPQYHQLTDAEREMTEKVTARKSQYKMASIMRLLALAVPLSPEDGKSINGILTEFDPGVDYIGWIADHWYDEWRVLPLGREMLVPLEYFPEEIRSYHEALKEPKGDGIMIRCQFVGIERLPQPTAVGFVKGGRRNDGVIIEDFYVRCPPSEVRGVISRWPYGKPEPKPDE